MSFEEVALERGKLYVLWSYYTINCLVSFYFRVFEVNFGLAQVELSQNLKTMKTGFIIGKLYL